MRLVEYGHIQPREVKCNHCDAVLEYTNNDLDFNEYTLRWYLRCLACGRIISTDNDGEPIKFQTTDNWR